MRCRRSRPPVRPPEDVGGKSGYENFLGIISDPKDPIYHEMLTWCGGHFDPEWFDLAIADKDVRNALRPGAKRRLHQPKPKKKRRSDRTLNRRNALFRTPTCD
jgi:hypothetical protein